jgi:hypothetical protein
MNGKEWKMASSFIALQMGRKRRRKREEDWLQIKLGEPAGEMAQGTGRRALTACQPEAGLPSSAIHPVTPEGFSLTWGPFTLYFEAEFEFNWMTIMGRMGWSNRYIFCTIK